MELFREKKRGMVPETKESPNRFVPDQKGFPHRFVPEMKESPNSFVPAMEPLCSKRIFQGKMRSSSRRSHRLAVRGS